MIKITVDAQVYEALQKAFPKPANTAHRALAKYISVLEAMLFKSLHFAATPLQQKLDLFTISLKELADRIGTIPYELLTNISTRVKRVYYLD